MTKSSRPQFLRQAKFLITTFLILLVFSSNAQQGNLCQLFYKAFNSADEGFAFLRPGTSTESIKDYSINEDSVKNYGLKKGSILKYTNIKSRSQNDKTYTAWTLLLSGQIYPLGDKKWNDVKENIKSTLTNFAKQYAENCLVQLQMSELILPTKDYDNELLTYYFYPKQIYIPNGADKDHVEALLNETTHIKFSVNKSVGVDGFYMGYSVNGIKYDQ